MTLLDPPGERSRRGAVEDELGPATGTDAMPGPLRRGLRGAELDPDLDAGIGSPHERERLAADVVRRRLELRALARDAGGYAVAIRRTACSTDSVFAFVFAMRRRYQAGGAWSRR
jgi:hypothetical protein